MNDQHSREATRALTSRQQDHPRLGTTAVLVAATLATVLVNALANWLRIGGNSTGSVSWAHPTLVTPAGYAFSIWSLIYLGLFAFAATVMRNRLLTPRRRARIFWAYLASSGLNALWIITWHLELVSLAALVIAALLASVVVMYTALDDQRASAGWATRLLLLSPISLYAAWLSVATVINVTIAVRANGLTGVLMPSPLWAMILMGVAFVLALAVALPRRDSAWLLVTAWALVAIGMARTEVPMLRLLSWNLAGLLVVMVAALVVARLKGPLRLAPSKI